MTEYSHAELVEIARKRDEARAKANAASKKRNEQLKEAGFVTAGLLIPKDDLQMMKDIAAVLVKARREKVPTPQIVEKVKGIVETMF